MALTLSATLVIVVSVVLPKRKSKTPSEVVLNARIGVKSDPLEQHVEFHL